MTTILLIDDSPEIHDSLRLAAQKNGYELISAYDGRTGVQLALTSSADIIILDVMLPHENGFDLCREIRSKGSATPVIFLTAKGDLVDKGEGFAAGGDDYVVKPFLSEELFMRISAVLRRSESALEAYEEKLGLVQKFLDNRRDVGAIRTLAERIRTTQDLSLLNEISALAQRIEDR